MTAFATDLPHPAAPLADALSRALHGLRARLHAPVQRLPSLRAAPQPTLHALPDHLLRDLGLSRGDLDRL